MARLMMGAASLLLALAWALPGAVAAAEPASSSTRTPVEPSYTISLTGTSGGRSWTGHETVSFKNAASISLHRIWLRLWSNGIYGCSHKSILVTKVSGGTAGSLSRDCTALPITLPAPLAPGATTTIGMKLSISVPARQDRFGFYQGVAMLGTALPTLAIHDGDGWHLDPYSALGESYYSVIGGYNVALTVPAALATATTGQLVSDTANGDGTHTRAYSATNVRDFEWAAGQMTEIDATDSFGTLVRAWYVPAYVTDDDAAYSLQNAVDAMETYSSDFGAYPYPEVDVVLSWIGFGMEYPQIVFTDPQPIYVTHEIAHQWWYGIVGDDEYDDPWLDESFATWSETLPFYEWQTADPEPWPSDTSRITRSMAYWANHTDDYWILYTQGANALEDAARHLGINHFIATLRSYAASHWFGFSTTADFKAAIRKAAAKWAPGWNVDNYWKKWRIGAG